MPKFWKVDMDLQQRETTLLNNIPLLRFHKITRHFPQALLKLFYLQVTAKNVMPNHWKIMLNLRVPY